MENSTVDTPLTIGGIYRPVSSGDSASGCKYRILLMDDREVLYDNFFPNLGWSVSDHLKSTCTFYRMDVEQFTSRYSNNGLMQLTDQEHEVIRPDLPLTVDIDITSGNPDNVVIAARKVLVEYYTPRARQPKLVVVSSKNINGLTHKEAVDGLSAIKPSGHILKGVRLKRTGIRRMLPLYLADEFRWTEKE